MSRTFCDMSDVLKLADGTINEEFSTEDLVHLTYQGQNKIAKKLNLKPVDRNGRFNVTSSLLQKQKHKADKPGRLERSTPSTGRRETSLIRHNTSSRSQHSIRLSNAAVHIVRYLWKRTMRILHRTTSHSRQMSSSRTSHVFCM